MTPQEKQATSNPRCPFCNKTSVVMTGDTGRKCVSEDCGKTWDKTEIPNDWIK